jgi:hypothetical protein
VWGLRPWGITISALAAVLAGSVAYVRYRSTGTLGEELVGAAALALVFLLLWAFRFTADWVRIPADAYAERLAETVESMGSKPATAEK